MNAEEQFNKESEAASGGTLAPGSLKVPSSYYYPGFNIGGGANNTLTIWTETGPLLERLLGCPLPIEWGDWRPGDQRICVMDIRKAQSMLGWSPKTAAADGLARLYQWVVDNRHLFEA